MKEIGVGNHACVGMSSVSNERGGNEALEVRWDEAIHDWETRVEGGEMVGREVKGRGISWACLSRKSLVRAALKECSEGARKRTVETVGGAVRMTRFTVVWRGGRKRLSRCSGRGPSTGTPERVGTHAERRSVTKGWGNGMGTRGNWLRRGLLEGVSV